MVAGGVESMSRAPFVMPKADSAFSRANAVYDTTIGWRFVNPADEGRVRRRLHARDGRERGGASSASSARRRTAWRWPASQGRGRAAARLLRRRDLPGDDSAEEGRPGGRGQDEHPRETSLEALARLKGVVRPDGTVTAGNASGVNDGACALLLASEAAARRFGLTPRARVVAMATAGVAPRIMGIGPGAGHAQGAGADRPDMAQIDVIELNEAFAAQGLAVTRDLGLADDDPRVNPNGGAIALGHPLGASGARLATTAVNQLHATGGRYACAPCASAWARASRCTWRAWPATRT
jgi:acetyl-CoA acyltransferase